MRPLRDALHLLAETAVHRLQLVDALAQRPSRRLSRLRLRLKLEKLRALGLQAPLVVGALLLVGLQCLLEVCALLLELAPLLVEERSLMLNCHLKRGDGVIALRNVLV